MEKLMRGPIVQYGDKNDGVIEFPVTTQDGHVVEVGYFYGDLKPKNIICISSQAGCVSRCQFCEAGKEGLKRNLTAKEMYNQVSMMLETAKQYGFEADSSKHKVSIVKTGESLVNPNTLEAINLISGLGPSFKLSTVFPNSAICEKTLEEIAYFSKDYLQPFQIQVSLVSTSEKYRREIIGIDVASKEKIRKNAENWRKINPHGRKFNLSLILAEDTPCEVQDVVNVLPPELVRFRFRPYIQTVRGVECGLVVISEERLKQIKEDFAKQGYEVGDWATPTDTEKKFGLASNVTRRRYLDSQFS